MKAAISFIAAIYLSSPAYARDDVLLRAVGFAITGNDNTKVIEIDRVNCVFGVDGETFFLNNVEVDRLRIKDWVRKSVFGQEHFVTVALHGRKTVYEVTTQVTEDSIDKGLAEAIKKRNPTFFTRRYHNSKQHTLTLKTDEFDRVERAWRYIYTNGCSGAKSPF